MLDKTRRNFNDEDDFIVDDGIIVFYIGILIFGVIVEQLRKHIAVLTSAADCWVPDWG
jgi:hypothetical protein